MSITTLTAPIDVLNLFPVYNSRKDYKAATGKDAPPFDPTKGIKTWADPNALSAPNGLAANGVQYSGTFAIYPIQNFNDLATDKPDILPLSRADAAVLNLPDIDGTTLGGTAPPSVLIPQRPLASDEAIGVNVGGMGIHIVNTTLQAHQQIVQQAAAGGFTDDDRAALNETRTILKQVAAKILQG